MSWWESALIFLFMPLQLPHYFSSYIHSVTVHSELLSLCNWRHLFCWKIMPLDEAFYSKAGSFTRVCLWWYTVALLLSWESSVKGPLRETSLQCLSQSCCILVLNSRQMCSCSHSVTWGQLYCIILRCTLGKGYRLHQVDTHFICWAIHTCTRTVSALVPHCCR